MLRAGTCLLMLVTATSIPAAAARGCGPAIVQLTVLDSGGNAVSGLAPGDFKVRVKNQVVNIAAMSYGVFPHSTLLLVSRTGSMGESLKVEMAKRLAAAVSAMAPGTVMAGSFVADLSAVIDGRSGDPFAVGPPINDEKRNAVYDAVVAGITRVAVHHGDAVVVFTDSPDSGSKTTAAEVRQRLAVAGVRLFVVALPATNTAGMQPFVELADASGGAFLVPLVVEAAANGVVISPPQIDAAVASFTRSYQQYNNVYQLETDQDGQDKALPLRVEVDRRKTGGGRVVAPAALAPCSAAGH